MIPSSYSNFRMTDVNQWIEHFKKMASGSLPPGSFHTVRNRGGGPPRSYFHVQPTVISPAQQVVDQAKAKAKVKTINRQRKRGVALKRKTKSKRKPKLS